MVRYHREAEKFILSQDKSTALRLYHAIEQLPLGDVKRLRGRQKPPLYRLRVGDYRIIFCQQFGDFVILHADTRGDAYKHL